MWNFGENLCHQIQVKWAETNWPWPLPVPSLTPPALPPTSYFSLNWVRFSCPQIETRGENGDKGKGVVTYSAWGGGLSPSTWYFLSIRLGLVYREVLWDKGGSVLWRLRTGTGRSEPAGTPRSPFPGLLEMLGQVVGSPDIHVWGRILQDAPIFLGSSGDNHAMEMEPLPLKPTRAHWQGARGRGARSQKLESLLLCGEAPKKNRLSHI